MPKTKTRPSVSVKIPESIAAKHRLRSATSLEVREFSGCLVIVPLHAKKNAKQRKQINAFLRDLMEQEAEDDMKAGRVSGPFATAAELLRDLKR